MSKNARGGTPPNRISSEEVFVSCAGHPSHVKKGEGRGEEEKGKEKGKGKGRIYLQQQTLNNKMFGSNHCYFTRFRTHVNREAGFKGAPDVVVVLQFGFLPPICFLIQD